MKINNWTISDATIFARRAHKIRDYYYNLIDKLNKNDDSFGSILYYVIYDLDRYIRIADELSLRVRTIHRK